MGVSQKRKIRIRVIQVQDSDSDLVVQLKKEQNFRICIPMKSKTESDAKVISLRPTHLQFSVWKEQNQIREQAGIRAMIDFSFGSTNFCGTSKRNSQVVKAGEIVLFVTCEEQKSVGREVFIYESQKGV